MDSIVWDVIYFVWIDEKRLFEWVKIFEMIDFSLYFCYFLSLDLYGIYISVKNVIYLIEVLDVIFRVVDRVLLVYKEFLYDLKNKWRMEDWIWENIY